jgi:LysR family hydrogen peroxide-inducible transcriptional activator
MAVDAGVTAGTNVILRPLAGRGAWRTIGLAWRPAAPREPDFRALAAVLATAFAPGEAG